MNKVWLRGTVTGTPYRKARDGEDYVYFSLFVKGAVPVPLAISERCSDPEYGNMIRCSARRDTALKLWDIIEEKMYINEIKGSIWTNGRNSLIINAEEIDLTDATTEERDYEPLNRALLAGYVSYEGYCNDLNGDTFEKKFQMVEDHGKKGINVKCYEEAAENAHIYLVKGKFVNVEGPINTWPTRKRNNYGYPVRDYAVIATKLKYKK